MDFFILAAILVTTMTMLEMFASAAVVAAVAALFLKFWG